MSRTRAPIGVVTPVEVEPLETRLRKLDACPEWITREQAAALAGVTTRTIDRWRALPERGEQPLLRTCQTRPLRPVRIRRDDLRALLTFGHERAPVAP